jgi:hypothetical protein
MRVERALFRDLRCVSRKHAQRFETFTGWHGLMLQVAAVASHATAGVGPMS